MPDDSTFASLSTHIYHSEYEYADLLTDDMPYTKEVKKIPLINDTRSRLLLLRIRTMRRVSPSRGSQLSTHREFAAALLLLPTKGMATCLCGAAEIACCEVIDYPARTAMGSKKEAHMEEKEDIEGRRTLNKRWCHFCAGRQTRRVSFTVDRSQK